MNITSVFNSSGEVGNWLTASTTNFTGSETLSLLMLVGGLLLVSALLKMPQLLLLIAIFPLILVISSVNNLFGNILGIAIVIAGITIASLWFTK